jgi:hypothetical protein
LADVESENLRLGRICLIYLALDIFDNNNLSDPENFPFMLYAADAWSYHVDKGLLLSQNLLHLVKKIFDPATMHWADLDSSRDIAFPSTKPLRRLREL